MDWLVVGSQYCTFNCRVCFLCASQCRQTRCLKCIDANEANCRYFYTSERSSGNVEKRFSSAWVQISCRNDGLGLGSFFETYAFKNDNPQTSLKSRHQDMQDCTFTLHLIFVVQENVEETSLCTPLPQHVTPVRFYFRSKCHICTT